MKAVIPAKTNSLRVKNKNYRPFFNGMSLVDIQISKLLGLLEPVEIYLSSEDPKVKVVAEKWGINFILRDEHLTSNEVPITRVIEEIMKQVPGNDDVMWCQVTDPTFQDYEQCLNVWKQLDRKDYDSLVVVYPFKHFLLDENHRPMGFGFGPWHKISQFIPTMYRLNFTLSIFTREAINKVNYYVGERPYWYEAANHTVDIDTESDWEMASMLFGQMGIATVNK